MSPINYRRLVGHEINKNHCRYIIIIVITSKTICDAPFIDTLKTTLSNNQAETTH